MLQTIVATGPAGIEPANVGVKVLCLTAWLRPYIQETFEPFILNILAKELLLLYVSLIIFTAIPLKVYQADRVLHQY